MSIIEVSENTARLISYTQDLYEMENKLVKVLVEEYGEDSDCEKEVLNKMWDLQSCLMKRISEQVTGNLKTSNFQKI